MNKSKKGAHRGKQAPKPKNVDRWLSVASLIAKILDLLNVDLQDVAEMFEKLINSPFGG